ncbi:hypothetical protein NON00_07475 [Roseomonas sp. GC11]|uniref:hypothetical protein n=1 Tax=Roseomonas sp. GC11 TaxID=2950546 RepID=UPI00210CD368|nr:hypothetical protein [Roseomonas sp. GC11]MCQ4159766.1 hypothetical protein [Roseomonas sp. GC11]
MGGLFRAPKPVVVTTPPAATPSASTTASPEAVAETARVDSQERARRGLAGTIATSARGVLDPVPARLAGTRKTLLGE